MADNPLDSLPPPSASANPLDSLPAPAKATQSLGGAAQAVGSGVAAGVTDLGGLAVDTGLNIYNLGKAGLGYAQSKVTGNSPSDVFDPTNPANVPLSSEWLKNRYRNAGLSGAVDPTEATNLNRYLHAGGEGVGASAGGGSVRGAAAAVGGALAQQGASDMGFGQGGSAAAGLLGALLTHRATSDAPGAKPTAQDLVDRSMANSPQSQGAAAASVDVTNASPQLQNGISQELQANGNNVNQQALQRHVQADRLGVQLSEGDATGDATQITNERNNPAMEGFRQRQNESLASSLEDMRDRVAPDLNRPTNEALIEGYKDKAKAQDKAIDNAYASARDLATVAGKGANIVDPQALLKDVQGRLSDQLLTDSAPKDALTTLQRLADSNQLTPGQFENLRTNLARTARSSTDGNTRFAAGVIRQALEDAPIQGEYGENVKAAFDNARSLYKDKVSAMDSDPAYKAVVNDKYNPDTFAQRYVIGGNSDTAAAMRENLKDNPEALQAMGAAAVEHLAKQSGLNENYEGNLAQSRYNKSLQALQPKLGSLVNSADAERLGDIGDVARYTQFQPEGANVNNSHTSQALLRHAAGFATENLLPLPGFASRYVAGKIEGATGRLAMQRAADEATRPGAGIGSSQRTTGDMARQILRGTGQRIASELEVNGMLRRAAPAGHFAHGALSRSQESQ